MKTATPRTNGAVNGKATVTKPAATPAPAYTSKHIKGENVFTSSLREIPLQKNKYLLTPAVEKVDRGGLEYANPVTAEPVEVYKLQSVLFNGALKVKKGTAVVKDKKHNERLNAIEDLFRFLRRFETRDVNEFMEHFEFAFTNYVESNKHNAEGLTYLNELQQLIRIILKLNDEPARIVSDFEAMTHAIQFGITLNEKK